MGWALERLLKQLRSTEQEILRQHYRVLLVDDIGIDRAFLSKMLTLTGLKLTIEDCANAQTAVELLNTRKYDFVLLDYFLKDETGLSVIQQIRKANNQVPFIVVSAYKDDLANNIVLDVLDAGASFFLSKPVSPEVLLHTVFISLQSRSMEEVLV